MERLQFQTTRRFVLKQMNHRYSLSFIILILTTFTHNHSVMADIYRYVDQNGVVHLTNVPTDPRIKYTLVYREKRVLFGIKSKDLAKYDHIINKTAEKYNVDPALIKAIIKAESNFQPTAISPKGARGLMQLMPTTASNFQVNDVFHPESNIEGGTRYLRYLIKLFRGDLTLALAAYNAGENAVIRHNGIPPYRETQDYVRRVLNFHRTYRFGK